MPRKTFKKEFVIKEDLEKINEKNKEFTSKFLKDKSSKLSDKSIENYRGHLNIFFTWNMKYNNNKSFIEIKKLEFSEYFSFVIDELKWGSARFNGGRSCLSSLSQFIEKFYDDEYPNFKNVILKIIDSTPKEERREKTILKDGQVELLLSYLFEKNKQKACWLSLAVFSGSRFSELLRFTTDIINEERRAFGDIFLETEKTIKTKGRGKGGKLLHKYILAENFLPYYRAWIEERKIIIEKLGIEDHKFIFINSDGLPIEDYVVRNWFVEFEKIIGVPFYPHSLRHYLTTLLSKKNIPPMLIKEIFGWAGVGMVELYDDTTARDKEWEGLDNLKSKEEK